MTKCINASNLTEKCSRPKGKIHSTEKDPHQCIGVGATARGYCVGITTSLFVFATGGATSTVLVAGTTGIGVGAGAFGTAFFPTRQIKPIAR